MIRPLSLTLSPEQIVRAWSGEPGLVWLDSARAGDARSWSWITLRPTLSLRDAWPEWTARTSERANGHEREIDRPPFVSGWIGFAAYEAAALLDPLLRTRPPENRLPLTLWNRYDASLAFRHEDRAWFLVGSDTRDGEIAAGALMERLSRLSPLGEASLPSSALSSSDPFDDIVGLETTLQRAEHAARVATILDWIGCGHIYQANLTYRASAPLVASPVTLYSALRLANPAPYGAYLELSAAGTAAGISAPVTIQSSSPELFLRIRDGRIETWPIKGTRRRDLTDPARDSALRAELLASEKDRAELLMIVDLERNDLGRLCRHGSIRVAQFPEIESFATVHHLMARISGELAAPTSFEELMRATFPGGSVTGAPKLRAMEILAELETAPRFVYTGELGWLDDSGDLELALAIRTLWTHESRAHFGVGGGIVADSRAEEEWEETRVKGRPLATALRNAAR